jgi:hypothetical protein
MKSSFYLEPELLAALSKQEQYLQEAEEYNQLCRTRQNIKKVQPGSSTDRDRTFRCCDQLQHMR